jgi:hypothetical protein
MSKKFILFSAAAILLSVAAILTQADERFEFPLPEALNDLAHSNSIQVKDGKGEVVLSGTFGTVDGGKKEVERAATMQGFPGKGTAEIELELNNGLTSAQELVFEVQDLAPVSSYTLWMDGKEAASFVSDKEGDASLKFSSKYRKWE